MMGWILPLGTPPDEESQHHFGLGVGECPEMIGSFFPLKLCKEHIRGFPPRTHSLCI